MDVDVVIASTFNSPAASPGRDPDADCDALHPGVKEAQEGSEESVGFGRRRFLCLRGFKSESSPSQVRVKTEFEVEVRVRVRVRVERRAESIRSGP